MQPGCRPAKTTTKYGANLAAKNEMVLLVNSIKRIRRAVHSGFVSLVMRSSSRFTSQSFSDRST